MTSRGGQWTMLLILAGGILSGPVAVLGDIVERSYGDSKGQKAATGFVLQGSRNMKRQGNRRSTTSSVILPPLSLEALSRKAPEKASSTKPKPRFGYGSDYQAEEGNKEVGEPQRSKRASVPTSVDPSTSVRFLPVRQNRTFYSRAPYYGYSSNPYFYRPGTAGRYYLHSPNCYSGGFSSSTSVNVYHGGNLTFSSRSPVFGYRYYR